MDISFFLQLKLGQHKHFISLQYDISNAYLVSFQCRGKKAHGESLLVLPFWVVKLKAI